MSPALFNKENRELFELIGTLWCATNSQLHNLYFRHHERKKQWNPHSGTRTTNNEITDRATRSRLKVLCDKGYLDSIAFGVGHRKYSAYHLTEFGRSIYADLSVKLPKSITKITPEEARRGWARAELWNAVRSPGTAQCDQSEKARAIASTLWGNSIPSMGLLPYDIVYAMVQGQMRAFMILVDDPAQDPQKIVKSLPLFNRSGPAVEVLVRPSDDGSVWDSCACQWNEGPRLAALRFLLKASPQYVEWEPKAFLNVGVIRFVSKPALV